MADYGFSLFCSNSPRIGQINFVVESAVAHIVFIAVMRKVCVHLRGGCRLRIIIAVDSIRIALSANGDIVRAWDDYDSGLFFGM